MTQKKKGATAGIGFAVLVEVILLFLFRLWPFLLLLLAGLIVYAFWTLFRDQKPIPEQEKEPPEQAPAPIRPEPVTEQTVMGAAFGLLQRRITEKVISEYPGARWVWGVPDAYHLFTAGRPLMVLLNGAGGYRRAEVQVSNLQFAGLCYAPGQDAASLYQEQGQDNPDDTESPEPEDVDYGLLAFEWLEANLQKLNAQANEAASAGQDTFRIHAEDLPHGSSWPAICEELVHNGFLTATPLADGIQVKIKRGQE